MIQQHDRVLFDNLSRAVGAAVIDDDNPLIPLPPQRFNHLANDALFVIRGNNKKYAVFQHIADNVFNPLPCIKQIPIA